MEWKAFVTVKDVLKAKTNKSIPDSLFNSTVLPATLYTRETLVTMKKEEWKNYDTFKRSLLRISLHERIQSKVI